MKCRVRIGSAIVALALEVGCGGSGGLTLGDGDATPGADAGSTTADATVSGDDAAPGSIFTSSGSDGSAIVVQDGPCAPGVYQGPFKAYIGASPDGGGVTPFSFAETGTLTIILSEQKVMMIAMSGGEVPTTTSTTTFSIADGGALDASDSIGGRFFANLVGQLDCSADAGPPYRFSATWSNALYSNPFVTVPLVGNMTADYEEGGAATPPMLGNGSIFGGAVFTPDSGQPYISASGGWSATWIGPPP